MATQLTPSHGRWSFPAGATGLAQYQFCALNSTGQLITPAATGVFAVVLDDAPNIQNSTLGSDGLYSNGYTVGQNYGTVFAGIMKVRCNATMNPGTSVMTDTNGKAIAAISGAVILGWTLVATSAGDIAEILLDRSYHN